MIRYLLALSTAIGAMSMLNAQVRRVEPNQIYERIICVVPMIGKGTPDDPRRPMFVPTSTPIPITVEENTKSKEDPSVPEITAWAFQESDDGKLAVVEFVAKNRAAFKAILESGRAEVKIFLKGRTSKAEIQNQVRQIRKDFDLDKLEALAQ